ncbi:hypothetical protein TRFO_28331 [Tritrichomonas foetus]|uniref:Transmembrane protein n=1 Tax=Tritrichomonas foetus TaxID=1144522 RepID=A0A1J4K3B9_9EUKA|nr:hypothetical protein TRFO_28331 [Tritrichomonas foetus]|eukprot:OHT04222.1 hypothetical protein TRFO_28331 [Tritrichomonas foetus]
MEATSSFPKFLVKWLRLFLILIPLIVIGYSIYWIILVTEPIFLAACGAGPTALAVLLMVASLASSIFAFITFKKPEKIDYSDWTFSAFFVSTASGILLCAIAMLMTTTESQRVFDSRISTYYLYNSDSLTDSYDKSYSTDYKKIVYQYSYGQSSYEAYLIIGFAWVICFVAFFATYENYPQ